ncbi:MAG: hypothetical protein RMK49_00505 [Abditibacteriales bacterium]|nr:hypothetical protein [Abditibacteriales bacterium]
MMRPTPIGTDGLAGTPAPLPRIGGRFTRLCFALLSLPAAGNVMASGAKPSPARQ